MDLLRCSFCPEVLRGFQSFRTHLENVHDIRSTSTPTQKIICKSHDCNREYSQGRTLFKHVKKYHCQKKLENESLPETSNEQKTNSEQTEFPFDAFMANMITNLRFSPTVTGAELGKFVSQTEIMLGNVMKEVKNRVEEFLESKNIDKNDEDTKKFINQFKFDKTYSTYKSLRGQIKAMREKYYYIDHRDLAIGYRNVKVTNEQNKIEIVKEPVNIQYVSVIDILKLILSNREVYEYVKNYENRENDDSFDDDIMSSHEDGELFLVNEFFKKFPQALGLHLYYDEMLVNNPLGNKKRQQKLGCFYISFLKLPKHLRDFIGGVHVIAIGKDIDIREFGMEECLRQFVVDMELLESDAGIVHFINGEKFVMHAALLNVVADTLAAHEVLRFSGPGSKFFCRLCMISTDGRLTYSWDATLRNELLHEEHVRLLQADDNAQRLTGVKENCILNRLKYFHCTINYTFDLMHDILEGQGMKDFKLVLKKLISNKKYGLNIDLINTRISQFNYGPIERKNQPAPTITSESLLSKDGHLQERAAQMWCLFRVFPFLVSDKVPHNDPYLQHILNLNKINEIVFAPKVSKSSLPYLQYLIETHIDQFRILFPSEKPINKLHHMSHYVMCLQKNGPMKLMTTFKYEAVHQIFKKFGSICCNFKDITRTMMSVSQMRQCSIWGTGKNPIRDRLTYTACEELEEDDEEGVKVLTSLGKSLQEKIVKVSAIQVFSTNYQEGFFVALDRGDNTEDNWPIFGLIESIYVINEDVYFTCIDYNTVQKEEALNAYNIIESTSRRLVKVDNLCDKKPYCTWKDYSSDYSYICLKYLLL